MKRNQPELSAMEQQIMKIIWDCEGHKIRIPELVQKLQTVTGYPYKRSTVISFIERLLEKEYITKERLDDGPIIRTKVREQTYLKQHFKKECELWFHGDYEAFEQYIKEMSEKVTDTFD